MKFGPIPVEEAAGAISAHSVKLPGLVIRKDDVVTVTYADAGVSLVLQAKALQSAAVGEAFSVVNPASKKVLQAVALGPAEAVYRSIAQIARVVPEPSAR